MELTDEVILAAFIGAVGGIIGGAIQSFISYRALIRRLKGERRQALSERHIEVGAKFFEAAFLGVAALMDRRQQDHREVVFLGERLKLVVDEEMATRVNSFTRDFASACMTEVPSDGPSPIALQDMLRGIQSDLRRSITEEI